MAAATVVSLDNVTVAYGKHVVLRDVSLQCGPGEQIGIRGVNGSGKTTLLRLLGNAFQPNLGARRGPATCAWVPATMTPPAMSANAWLTLPRPRRGDAASALRLLGFDGDRGAPSRSLSFGNFRKLMIAEALTSGERLLLIDEATSGLDDLGISGLRALMVEARAGGACIVVADQDSRDIPDTNRVLRVHDGEVAPIHDPSRTIELTFRGTADRAAALRAAAEDVGFLPVSS